MRRFRSFITLIFVFCFTTNMASFPGTGHILPHVLSKHLDNIPNDKNVIFFCSTGSRIGESY
ncbi:hypothetical protein [uncultured Desulfovibrio sp.]|uniref:hypothetical protein n=1 Tax=uncultured Desulfovibrio sp. TaxID=167968 RepID=UPI0025914357|nr:hypothetical protein [uncultured Desulfovibrio sp.]